VLKSTFGSKIYNIKVKRRKNPLRRNSLICHLLLSLLGLLNERGHTATPTYPACKQPEFSSNQQHFERKFTIFIQLFKNKFVTRIWLPITWWFPQLPLAVLSVILPYARAITAEAN
jgi:hypothetical protein